MKNKFFGKYLGMLTIGVILIAVYKTFDNLEILWHGLLYFLGILSPVVLAFAIAFLLHPLCYKLETLLKKSKLKFINNKARGISVLSVYALIVLILTTTILVFVPYIKKSINDFSLYFPFIVSKVTKFFEANGFYTLNIEQYISVNKIIEGLNFTNISGYISSIIGAGSAIFGVFLSAIMSIYILIDRKNLKTLYSRITTLYVKESILLPFNKYARLTSNYVYKYVFCQLIDAGVVIVLASILLSIMKVKYSVILGIFIGIMNLIPYFGAIIACVIVTVITVFFSGLSKGLWVLVALLILQQVDSNLIQPAIVKEGLSVKPFWVLVGILVGGTLFGVVGILLAVPVMAILKTIINDILTDKEEKASQRRLV